MAPPSNYAGKALDLHKYMKSLPQEQFRNSPKALLDALQDYVDNKESLMTFDQEKLDATEQILAKLDPPPRVLVELGGYVGMSAVAWAPMLSRLQQLKGGDGKDVQVFSLELEPDFCKIIQDFIEIAGIAEQTKVVQGPAGESLQSLAKSREVKSIDVLFIDHWEKHYLPDLKICQDHGLLRKGSVVVADNTDFPDLAEFVKYLNEGGDGWKFEVQKLDFSKPDWEDWAHIARVVEVP